MTNAKINKGYLIPDVQLAQLQDILVQDAVLQVLNHHSLNI